MLTSLLILTAGLALLSFGAEGLVRGSASLALRHGLTPLFVGLTIVAFGTSAPELAVSIKANLAGQGDIAVGNVLGSNIFNIGMVLGPAALLCPIRVRAQLVRLDMPILVGVTTLFLFLFHDRVFSRLEGGFFFAGLIAYLALVYSLARKREVDGISGISGAEVVATHNALLLDLAFIAGGMVMLVAGARFLVDGAVQIARLVGVSEAVIGLTMVAAGTSLPEMATSVVAALRRQPDIAIGNVVGSNLFNLLSIMGLSSLVRPLAAPGIQTFDLVAMLIFAVVLLALMRAGLLLRRWQGLLLVALYLGYAWGLLYR